MKGEPAEPKKEYVFGNEVSPFNCVEGMNPEYTYRWAIANEVNLARLKKRYFEPVTDEDVKSPHKTGDKHIYVGEKDRFILMKRPVEASRKEREWRDAGVKEALGYEHDKINQTFKMGYEISRPKRGR